MSKRTPGPWVAYGGGKRRWAVGKVGGGHCVCQLTQHEDGEAKANAKFIAASPALYEACLTALRTLADWDRDDGEAGDALREALSAAGWDGEL